MLQHYPRSAYDARWSITGVLRTMLTANFMAADILPLVASRLKDKELVASVCIQASDCRAERPQPRGVVGEGRNRCVKESPDGVSNRSSPINGRSRRTKAEMERSSRNLCETSSMVIPSGRREYGTGLHTPNEVLTRSRSLVQKPGLCTTTRSRLGQTQKCLAPPPQAAKESRGRSGHALPRSFAQKPWPYPQFFSGSLATMSGVGHRGLPQVLPELFLHGHFLSLASGSPGKLRAESIQLASSIFCSASLSSA